MNIFLSWKCRGN